MPRPVITCCLCLAIGLVAAGCISVEPGDTVIHITEDDLEVEKHLRRELWRIERAVEQVRVHYGLEDITVEIDVRDIGGLGETGPAFDHFHVAGAQYSVNKRLFIDDHPDLDDIIMGLTAHELAHALHYARMSRQDLITLGYRYGEMMKHPDGPQKDWVRAYEQLTDMTAIAMGYAEPLKHQKVASEKNLIENHPPLVWDFYLTPEEIATLDADRTLLRARIHEALEILDLPSLRDLIEHPNFDADGDLVTRRP